MNHFQKVSWKKITPLALIFLFLVSASLTAGSLLPSVNATGVQLTVQTDLLNGTPVNGLYVVIYSSSGTILDTGYSPLTYTVTSGNTYKVQVDNYQQYVFSNWAGGSTSDPITVTISSSTTLTAYYNDLAITPAPSSSNLLNAVQQQYGYLNRLLKVDGAAPNTNNTFLSEYPALPLSVQYGNGEIFPASGSILPGGATTITTNSMGTTSESFTYDWIDPYNPGSNCPNGYGNSPTLMVNMTWNGYGVTSTSYQVNYWFKIVAYDETDNSCYANIYLGGSEVMSGITHSSVGQTASLSEVIQVAPFLNQGLVNGPNFGAVSSTNVVPPEQWLGSERYTLRSGVQSAYKWLQASEATGLGSTVLALQNALSQTAYTNGLPTFDIYSPSWLVGQGQSLTSEDNSNVYNDCKAAQFPTVFDNVFGYAYMYQSKVCVIGVSNYLCVVYGQDPLQASEQAIQVDTQYGPNYAGVYWHGSTITPSQYASDLVSQGWIDTVPSTTLGDYVYYTNVNLNAWGQCGITLSPNTNEGSSVRTSVTDELFTLLGFGPTGMHDNSNNVGQDQTISTRMADTIVNTTWGIGTGASNGLAAGIGYEGSTQYFRPADIGGGMVGFNPSNGYALSPSPSFSDMFNMANEYNGLIPANQESTQSYLSALLLYLEFAPTYDGGCANNGYTAQCSENMGLQPFSNFMFFNSGTTIIDRTFSVNGEDPNGNYYAVIDVNDQGDQNCRYFNVYLNGVAKSTQVPCGFGTGNYNQFVVNLGSLSSGQSYTLGIEYSTYNYTSPGDYVVISASIVIAPTPVNVYDSGFITTSQSSVSFTITPTYQNELFYFEMAYRGGGTFQGITSSQGIPVITRFQGTGNANYHLTGYGYAPKKGSSDTITISFGSALTEYEIVGFGVAGFNANAYPDQHSGIPYFASGSGTSASASLSLNSGYDMVVTGFDVGHVYSDTVTYPSGYTAITSGTTSSWLYMAYQDQFNSQSPTLTWKLSPSDSYELYADALSTST